MIVSSARWFPILLFSLVLAGCQRQEKPVTSDPPPDPEADIKANLAQLSPEDQRLAKEQKYCPVMREVQLGEMGPPFKIVVQGETMFVCCKNCARRAPEDAENTLAQLKEIRQTRAQELQQHGATAPGK
jgi:hypothetical protein